jgi:hypothetical protein
LIFDIYIKEDIIYRKKKQKSQFKKFGESSVSIYRGFKDGNNQDLLKNRIDECFIDHCIRLFEDSIEEEFERKIQFKIYQATKKNPKKEDKEFPFDWDQMKSEEIPFSKFADFGAQQTEKLMKKSKLYKMSFDTPYGTSFEKAIKIWNEKRIIFFPENCVPSMKVFKFNGGDFVSDIFDEGLEWW